MMNRGVFGLLVAACVAVWGTLASAAPEVHVVSIYEPLYRDGENFVPPEVKVVVDRPGAEVHLVLSSFVATRWLISTTADTNLTGVVMGADGRRGDPAQRSEVLLNGTAFTQIEYRALPMTYQMRGRAFRQLVAAAPKILGVAQLNSFQGAYTAPEGGFVVSVAQDDNPLLSLDYLAASVMDPAQVPETLRPYLNLDAPRDAAGEKITLSESGFEVTQPDGTRKVYPTSLDVPRVSWAVGTARDPESGKLYGVTLGGEGLLYSFDPASGKWAIASSMKQNDASGMIYDPTGRRLVIVVSGMVATKGPALFFYGMDGQKTKTPLALEAFPGLMDIADPGNGPGASLIPLAVDGSKILLQTADGFPQRRPGVDPATAPTRIYLVDMASGEVKLAAYRDAGSPGTDEW